MAAREQNIEVENRKRFTIDLGTFDNPGGKPERVHVFLGSSDDAGHPALAPKNALVIGEDKVAPPIRVFPRAVWEAAFKLKAVAGMVDNREIVFRGV
jgi:hypothetical protein